MTVKVLIVSVLIYVGIIVFGFFFYVRGHGEAIGAYDEPIATEIEECIFDQATQTDEFIKNVPEFSNYTWNDSAKMATIILVNGDSIYASRGGCNQFEILGKWIQQNDLHLIKETDYWLNQGIWLSNRLMSENDSKELMELIKTKSYILEVQNDRLYISFNGHNYSEWYLTVEKDGNQSEIETGFYFD